MGEGVDDDKAIEKIINDFQTKMHILSSLATAQLKHAKENQEAETKAVKERRQASFSKLHTTGATKVDLIEVATHVDTLLECENSLSVLEAVSHEALLAEILFVSIFSGFDAYLRNLLRKLFLRPNILKTMGGKSIEFKDVLKFEKSQLAENVVDNELDSLLRESLTDIFKKLESRFGVSTLRNFASWPQLVETSQRRNLVVHCDGRVTEQYLEKCRLERVELDKDLAVGAKLTITKDYLNDSMIVINEVGVMLGQTLWRLSGDTSTASADTHLGELLFDLLKREEWALAKRLGNFGRELTRLSHKTPRNDRSLKIIVINHAQAAKWSGNSQAAQQIIREMDWSGSAFEFQLAVAVLEERWEDSAKLMHKIGIDSKAIPIHGYAGWPIFRDFRNKPEFSEAIQSIFGVGFLTIVERSTAEEGAHMMVKPESKSKSKPRQKEL